MLFLFMQAYIEGYTSLLGISTYVRLNLTMTQIELLVQGNFLNLIKAELFLTASYSYTSIGGQFYVRVTVDLSGINKVSENQRNLRTSNDMLCYRAVFSWVSKVMLCLLWFCFTSLSDWLKKARAIFPTNQT